MLAQLAKAAPVIDVLTKTATYYEKPPVFDALRDELQTHLDRGILP